MLVASLTAAGTLTGLFVYGSVAGVLKGQFVALVVASPFLMAVLRNELRLALVWGELVRVWRFASPLIVVLLASVVLNLSGRAIVNQFSTLAQVGVFTLGFQIGAIPNMVVNAADTAWFPVFARNVDNRAMLSRLLTYFVGSVFISTLFTISLGPALVRIVATEEFYGAICLIPWFSTAFLLLGLSIPSQTVLMYHKRTARLGWIHVLVVATYLTLVMFLVPRHGALGAAISTCGAYFVNVPMCLLLSRRLQDLRFECKRILKLVVVGVLAVGLLSVVRVDEPIPEVLIRGTGLSVLLTLGLGICRFATDEEKRLLRNATRSILHAPRPST